MSESMREEFEAAVGRDWPEIRIDFDRNGSFYRDQYIDSAWWAWQASRAALCVELPVWEQYDDDMVSGAATAINDCRDAIHAAGVKTN